MSFLQDLAVYMYSRMPFIEIQRNILFNTEQVNRTGSCEPLISVISLNDSKGQYILCNQVSNRGSSEPLDTNLAWGGGRGVRSQQYITTESARPPPPPPPQKKKVCLLVFYHNYSESCLN